MNTKRMVIAANKLSDAGSQKDILGDSERGLWGSNRNIQN